MPGNSTLTAAWYFLGKCGYSGPAGSGQVIRLTVANRGNFTYLAGGHGARASLVATRVGGNPEVVEDGVTGFLVPARDPTALAQAIRTVLADSDLGRRMGLAGRQRVENCFDIRKMMTQYEALYEMEPNLA